MSSLFIDAISGFTQGAQEAGATIQRGQEQQVAAAWKNRELAMQDEKLDMAQRKLTSDLTSAEQARSITGEEFEQRKKGFDLQDKQRTYDTMLTDSKIATFDPVQEKKKAELAYMGDINTLTAKLSQSDQLKEAGFDVDSMSLALKEHAFNRIMAPSMARAMGAKTTGTGSSTAQQTNYGQKDTVDDAVNTLKALLPALETVKDPKLSQLATDLTQFVTTAITSGYAAAEVAELKGKSIAASSYLQQMQDRERVLQGEKQAAEDLVAKKQNEMLKKTYVAAPEGAPFSQGDSTQPDLPMPGEAGFEEFVQNRPLSTQRTPTDENTPITNLWSTSETVGRNTKTKEGAVARLASELGASKWSTNMTPEIIEQEVKDRLGENYEITEPELRSLISSIIEEKRSNKRGNSRTRKLEIVQ